MTFKFSIHVDPEGMTVPYPLRTDGIQRNREFVDFRGRPDKAREIAEGADSPALRNLLVQVANRVTNFYVRVRFGRASPLVLPGYGGQSLRLRL